MNTRENVFKPAYKQSTWVACLLLGASLPATADVRIIEPVVIPAQAMAQQSAPSTVVPVVAQEKKPAAPAAPAVAPVQAPKVTPPAAPAPSITPVATPAAPAAPVAPAPQAQAAIVPVPTPATALEPEFAFASAKTQYTAPKTTSSRGTASLSRNVQRSAAELEEREVMRARMRIAVEKVASEFGNPVFAEVFTNDPLRARVLGGRLKLLQNYEELVAQIAALEQQRNEVAESVDEASRQRMAQIQAEIRQMEQQRKAVADAVSRAVQGQASAIAAEMARLERDKAAVAADLEAKRQELTALREEAKALNQRLSQARSTLAAAIE